MLAASGRVREMQDRKHLASLGITAGDEARRRNRRIEMKLTQRISAN